MVAGHSIGSTTQAIRGLLPAPFLGVSMHPLWVRTSLTQVSQGRRSYPCVIHVIGLQAASPSRETPR